MMFGISDNHAQVVDTQYGAAQTNEGTEFLWSLLWILIVRVSFQFYIFFSVLVNFRKTKNSSF